MPFRIFSGGHINGITSEIKSSDFTLNIGCELSQPMGKTEFSSTTKNKTLFHG